ncbi:hypothetical protein HOH87_06025 [bacterium]|jgi:hypothetical protein|nr:hypothetical protein [bacterium]
MQFLTHAAKPAQSILRRVPTTVTAIRTQPLRSISYADQKKLQGMQNAAPFKKLSLPNTTWITLFPFVTELRSSAIIANSQENRALQVTVLGPGKLKFNHDNSAKILSPQLCEIALFFYHQEVHITAIDSDPDVTQVAKRPTQYFQPSFTDSSQDPDVADNLYHIRDSLKKPIPGIVESENTPLGPLHQVNDKTLEQVTMAPVHHQLETYSFPPFSQDLIVATRVLGYVALDLSVQHKDNYSEKKMDFIFNLLNALKIDGAFICRLDDFTHLSPGTNYIQEYEINKKGLDETTLPTLIQALGPWMQTKNLLFQIEIELGSKSVKLTRTR